MDLQATRPLYWSIRRELWENRSIVIAPLAAAAVVLFGFTIHVAATLPSRMSSLHTLDAARQHTAVVTPYGVAASVVVVAAYIVGAFYCVDTLHGERRDRSILFWKSLPVSDRTTVLAKASIPLLVLPSIAYGVGLATQLAMLLLSTAVLTASGVGAGALWSRLPLPTLSVMLLYGLAVNALWHAPIYGWLLLVSAWARRTPVLWAVLPPLALVALERITFQTSHVAALLKHRVAGGIAVAFDETKGAPMRLARLDPAGFLTSAGLWIGLAAAVFFLVTVMHMRRRAEPI